MTSGTCQVSAWCPVEIDVLPLDNRALLEQSKHFTVLIKNHIYFPKFNKQRSNILESQTEVALESCIHSDKEPFCPVFTLGYILEQAQQDYAEVAVRGGSD